MQHPHPDFTLVSGAVITWAALYTLVMGLGARWDFLPLVQNHGLDFIRVSLPNTGGITEMIRICAICETMDQLKLAGTVDRPGENRPTYYRPDDSQFTW
ncbi:MAG: enolase C-terminal domain-like protein [Pseudomonadota bacterium]